MYSPHRRPRTRAAITLALILGAAAPRAAAQAPPPSAGGAAGMATDLISTGSFLRPPEPLARLVTAPWHHNARLSDPSPDGKYLLRIVESGLPSIEDLARPYLNLAGLQIDPAAKRRRDLALGAATGLEVVEVATGRTRRIQTPAGATLSFPRWSPDGSRIAFVAHFMDASRAYLAEVSTGETRVISGTPLLATQVTRLQWTADGKRIVAVIVPDGQTAAPARPATITGPQVRLATGTRQRHRTYPSLLQDEYDEQALEHYLTGQLALLDTDGRGVRKIGAPAMIVAVDPSPFGDHFRMRLVRKPFSYIVPYADFGEVEQLWDANGKVLIELGTRPLRDGTERRTNGDGANVASSPPRRSLAWHPSGMGLTYLQRAPAQAGGDEVPDSTARAAASPDSAKKRAIASLDSAANSADTAPARTPATRPDRLYHWLPPFGPEDARVLYESENALSTVRFAEDGESIFVTEYVDGGSHTYAVHLNSPERRYTLLRIERPVTAADSAAAELARGSIVMRDAPGMSGRVVRRSTDGRYIYLDGLHRAALPPGNASPTPADTTSRPFVDRVEIATGARERLYHAPAGEVVELLTSVVDDDVTRILVRREARTIVPDYYLRDPRAGTLTPLTRNTDHAPEITHARRDRIQVTRPDGFRFWVNLTLPRDYREGTRLPAFFWFYPREYANQEAYDRMVFEIPNRFQVPGPRSLEFLVTQGYAVVQPDAPVVGPQGRINDNYLHDLRNNLAAVIDELDRRGYIDRGRLGLGGHSYGAFSTVNAMIHTPFFRAGIAGDGNYNRTLTPNGFQTEERDLWERRETYLELSPLLYADRLTGALLLYHGLADQNPGTDPVNSIRLLQALQGLGKTAALYLYHHEDHEPQARETILDMWARWTAWLDRYLKAAGPGSVATTGADRTASPRETATPVRP